MTAATDVPWITTSERRAFKRCPQRWWWAYREGLLSHDGPSPALWFGIGIHEALAALYQLGKKRNKDFIDLWRDYCDNDEISRAIRTRTGGELDEAEWVNARALGVAMLTGYVDHYNWDKSWDVIYTEEPFQILIPHPEDSDQDIALFTSTFDGVYRDEDKKCYLMEHKTAASITLGHLPMDDQGGSYWAVATQVLRDKGILAAKERIHGINYNFLRKALPDDRPKDAEGYACNKPVKEHYIAALTARGFEVGPKMTLAAMEETAAAARIRVLGERSKQQPAPLFVRELVLRSAKERATQIRRIGEEAHAMNAFRNGDIGLYKNPTPDCTWDCSFYNLCQLHEQQQDYEEFKAAVFKSVNPYERYMLRKSASA